MNITQLDQDTDFLCGSTSATYTTADKRRNHNIAYQDVARLIWESDGNWTFNKNVAYKTLTAGVGTYTIPTTALRINFVEVKDQVGTWHRLKPITYNDIPGSPESYLTGGGLPVEYLLDGNDLRVFPAAGAGSVTMASGIALNIAEQITEIPVSATTASPAFPSPFHRILSYAAAIDFTKDENDRKNYSIQKARLEAGLVRYIAKRATEYKSRINPSGRRNWRQYT